VPSSIHEASRTSAKPIPIEAGIPPARQSAAAPTATAAREDALKYASKDINSRNAAVQPRAAAIEDKMPADGTSAATACWAPKT
jgi:hypothetical protein